MVEKRRRRSLGGEEEEQRRAAGAEQRRRKQRGDEERRGGDKTRRGQARSSDFGVGNRLAPNQRCAHLARFASPLSTYATKPHRRPRACSSSVLGHMIFTDWMAPKRENRLKRTSSVMPGLRLPTYRFVVSGSPLS